MSRLISNRYNLSNFWDPFFEPLFVENKENRNIGYLQMKTDIAEFKDHYELAVDLPGFEKKDLSIDYQDGYLTITAETKENNENGKFLRRERFYGKASRSYYVGEIEQSSIKATFKNGVLEISVPKEDLEKKNASHSIAIM